MKLSHVQKFIFFQVLQCFKVFCGLISVTAVSVLKLRCWLLLI